MEISRDEREGLLNNDPVFKMEILLDCLREKRMEADKQLEEINKSDCLEV